MRAALLCWFDAHARDLPWRARRPALPNPYHVLVSEAMLQQTQVATVIPYFGRFLDAFPTLDALAAADEQAVLTQWQGLGYYRRARNLHAAAKTIVAERGGVIPQTVAELRALPGVGRYTAGAIASIAFGEPAPIVDGNVARVLARLAQIERPIDERQTLAQLWELAERLVPADRPGDFNQAMMELGATVCTPTAPKCPLCPLAKWCQARAAGLAEELPVKRGKAKPKPAAHVVIAIERRGKWLFQQRDDAGLWAGMWQMPTVEHDLCAKTPDVDAALAAISETTGLALAGLKVLGAFPHQTTHRSITFHIARVAAEGGRLRRGGGVWRSLRGLEGLPLSNPQRKVVVMLRGG